MPAPTTSIDLRSEPRFDHRLDHRVFARLALAVSLVALAPGCGPRHPAKAAAPPDAGMEYGQITAALDDWHDAATKADEDRYFGYFATDAIFLGTDATERWDADGFRAYAHPHFAEGKAWSFRAMRRAITIAPSGVIAWFDEELATENLGAARGSGVLVKQDRAWKIAQYNLAITVPNERLDAVKRTVAGENPCRVLPPPPAPTPK